MSEMINRGRRAARDNEIRGMNIEISLNKLIKGGAPPLASRAIKAHIDVKGVKVCNPLVIIIVRVWVFSYRILVIENKRDLTKPCPIFIIMMAIVAQ